MGIDYDAVLAVGYTIWSRDELERPFTQKIEEVAHTETRFDEITGIPYEKKIVVCEAGERVIMDGEDYTHDVWQLAEDVTAKLAEACGFDLEHEIVRDLDANLQVVIGPSFKWDDGDLDPDQLHDIQFRKARLAKALTDLGYEPGEFRVRALLSVS